MRPDDERIGRKLVHGRFEVVEWVGGSEWTGVVNAVDEQGRRLRVTTASDVSVPFELLRPWLARDIKGLAPVVYLGPGQSDDGWGEAGLMMAEVIPAGSALNTGRAWDIKAVAEFGNALLKVVGELHSRGVVIATLRPEGIYLANGSIALIVRGERLWLMPRANASKSASIPPWPYGYVAPDLIFKPPVLEDVPRSADVFSVAVIIAELLLGKPPYPTESLPSLIRAQRAGEHAQLPSHRLSAVLSRALQWEPEARPTFEELSSALAGALE